MAAYYSGGGGGGGKLSAVDAILAEAADLVALEQIAKLNTAHLAADDFALPSSLEARFRKLKSLPSAAAPPPVRTLTRSVTAPGPAAAALPGPNPPPPAPATAPAPPQHQSPATPAPAVHEDPPQPPPGDAETIRGEGAPPAQVSAVHADAEDLERLFGSAPRGRPTLRERNRGRDSSSSSASPSPPRQACCFGFSPKKPLQRTPSSKGKTKKKVHHGSGGDVLGVDADEWGDENSMMVTELREQQRRLRKALQDQVRVSRETAKMARWVKQASARMTHVEAIDDLLSDCEDDEELK